MAAGAAAVPSRVKGAKLTGGVVLSASRRRGREPDEQGPLVSDHTERGQRAQHPRGPSTRADLGRVQAGHPRSSVFFFFFLLKNA